MYCTIQEQEVVSRAHLTVLFQIYQIPPLRQIRPPASLCPEEVSVRHQRPSQSNTLSHVEHEIWDYQNHHRQVPELRNSCRMSPTCQFDYENAIRRFAITKRPVSTTTEAILLSCFDGFSIPSTSSSGYLHQISHFPMKLTEFVKPRYIWTLKKKSLQL